MFVSSLRRRHIFTLARYFLAARCAMRGHYNTAYRMFKRGEIAGYQLPTGTVIIEEPIEKAVVEPEDGHLIAVYARVSSSENKRNLDTQAERPITWCNAQGWSVGKVVKEVGSGIT